MFAAAGAFAARSMELYNSIDGAAFRNQYFAEGCEVTRKLCDARRGRRHLERKIRKANMGMPLSIRFISCYLYNLTLDSHAGGA